MIYKIGDRVRILRGKFKGKVFTVNQSTNDWVTVKELPKKVLSTSSIEPEGGFPLVLESKMNMEDKTFIINIGENRVLMMAPLVNPDYWVFRIQLHPRQALVAFPKFGGYGIGFQYERRWNTNLPYNGKVLSYYKKQFGDDYVSYLFNHIKQNKRYKSISDEKCKEAIRMLIKACEQLERGIPPKEII